MRKKQLFAIFLAGALTLGMVPCAAFAAEEPVPLSIEGEVAATSEGEAEQPDETPAEQPDEQPAEQPTETPAEQPTEAPAEQPTETPAEQPTETPAEQPTETPAEQPAETPTEQPTTAPAETPAEDSATLAKAGETPEDQDTEAAISIGSGDQATTYNTLKEAVAAAATMGSTKDAPVQIDISGDVKLAETVEISENVHVKIVGATAGSTITRDEAMNGNMFSVKGGTLLFQVALEDAENNLSAGTLTVNGDFGDKNTTGSIILVESGTFGMEKGVTLTGNTVVDGAASMGGAICNTGGEIYLTGGNITGNEASTGGGIYSEGSIFVSGSIQVNGNNSDAVTANNITLKGANASITAVGKLEDTAKLLVNTADIASGTQIIKLKEGTDTTLSYILTEKKLIELEGADKNTSIDSEGKLIITGTATVTPTPTTSPSPSAAVELPVLTGKSMKWVSHTSAEITAVSTKDGYAYAEWVVKGSKAPAMNCTGEGQRIFANTNFTINLSGFDPDKSISVYLRVKDDEGNLSAKKLLFNLSDSKRPGNTTTTVTPTPSRKPYTPKVTESTVKGLSKPLEFYPNTFYEFTVTGAGTENKDPIEGDVRWVPLYWSTSSNPSGTAKNTTWRIGAKTGIPNAATYNLYVFFRKDVYKNGSWEPTDIIQSATFQFSSAKIDMTKLTITPTGKAGNGTGEGGDDGDYDPNDPETRTADGSVTGASKTTKNAVSTADNSPIGTMMMLAAVSILAGGYVLIRKRKKVNE